MRVGLEQVAMDLFKVKVRSLYVPMVRRRRLDPVSQNFKSAFVRYYLGI